MELTNRKLFIIALILGLITTGLIYFYLLKIEENSKVEEPIKEVVIAKVTISPRTTITKEMIEIKSFNVSSLPPSFFLDEKKVIGQIAKEPIYKGEPIIPQRIADETYRKIHLTYSIPKGYRAVTLQYNPVMGVGGFIQPGDYIDIIGTYQNDRNGVEKDISKIIIQNIFVLAVGEKVEVNTSKINEQINTITLAVTPYEAEKITFTEETASVRLILRPLHEDGLPSTTGSTIDNIITP